MRRRTTPSPSPAAIASAVLALAAIAVAALGHVSMAPAEQAGARPAPVATATADASAESSASAPETGPPVEVRVIKLAEPTPIFASYRSLLLHLPVRPSAVTLLAWHQAASGNDARHMTSLVTPPATSSADPTGPDETAEIEAAEPGVPRLWSARSIRLYRSGRDGPPDTAADCGAAAGTAVFSPVSGTVRIVRPYELYGQYFDYEIHIEPNGWPGVDVVLLHVTDVSIRKGDRVEAGVTRVAAVRNLAKYFDSQLAEYTHDGGNHVHVQVNSVPIPGRLTFVGEAQTQDAPKPSAPVKP